MKTLLISEVFPPQVGGSGHWFWEVYRRFPQDDAVVTAGCSGGWQTFDAGHTMRVHRLPLALRQWGVSSPSTSWRYLRLAGRLRRIASQESCDVVHAGRILPEGWLAWLLKLTIRRPYLCYVHGEELSYGFDSRQLAWMMRRVLAEANCVVANSHNTARLLQKDWKVPDGKVCVLHPGVDTHRFVPERRRNDLRKSLGWGERPVILTVGRLQLRKGHDTLIRALPQITQTVPDVLYVIAGEGTARQNLEDLVRELRVESHVQFLGEINDCQLLECYQQCDVFALPNRAIGGDIEGFGIVLLEAQACGKPVVAGDSGGTRETMISGETGLIVDCTHPGSLAETLESLLTDVGRCRRMGQAGRNWVVDRFDWNVLATQAKVLFEQRFSANGRNSALKGPTDSETSVVQ